MGGAAAETIEAWRDREVEQVVISTDRNLVQTGAITSFVAFNWARVRVEVIAPVTIFSSEDEAHAFQRAVNAHRGPAGELGDALIIGSELSSEPSAGTCGSAPR